MYKKINIHNLSQIRWNCRRGIKELEILLISFFDRYFDNLSKYEKHLFVHILKRYDIDLFNILLNNKLSKNDIYYRHKTMFDLIIRYKQHLIKIDN